MIKLLVICLLSWMPLGDSKKETILNWSRHYFPEYYPVLQAYSEDEIDQMAPGKDPETFIFDIPTVVHEAWHSYHTGYSDSAVEYRITDTLSFSISNFNSFPARNLNKIVPAALQKSIFRYDTYINSNSKYLVTQQFGIHGIMEEFCAYYHSMRCNLALFQLLQDKYGFKKSKLWVKYLGAISSYRYSLHEFSLFTSWYLQYARQNHPAVYTRLIKDTGFRALFRFLDGENTRLAQVYDSQRQIIMQQSQGRLAIMYDSVLDTQTNSGQGLFDKETERLKLLLQSPEHEILDLLRKP